MKTCGVFEVEVIVYLFFVVNHGFLLLKVSCGIITSLLHAKGLFDADYCISFMRNLLCFHLGGICPYSNKFAYVKLRLYCTS